MTNLEIALAIYLCCLALWQVYSIGVLRGKNKALDEEASRLEAKAKRLRRLVGCDEEDDET